MKVKYIHHYDAPSRAGQRVMCRDMEPGETAKDGGTFFEMTEEGLYIDKRFCHSWETILEYRINQYRANRIVTIL